MNNNTYKLKYYKYKNKYLELKQKTLINQEGGYYIPQIGKIGFFIDKEPTLGYDNLTVNVDKKEILKGYSHTELVKLSYNELCGLSCAVVKQDQSAKEWIFPIVKRSQQYDDKTLNYKRNSELTAKIENEADVEITKKEVLSCLSDLNKIIQNVKESNETTPYRKRTLGYIDRRIRYCIVCDVNFLGKPVILHIYKFTIPLNEKYDIEPTSSSPTATHA
jgi:hypothetical protein